MALVALLLLPAALQGCVSADVVPLTEDFNPGMSMLSEGRYQEAADLLARKVQQREFVPGETLYALALANANAGRPATSNDFITSALSGVSSQGVKAALVHLRLVNALQQEEPPAIRRARQKVLGLAESTAVVCPSGQTWWTISGTEHKVASAMRAGRRALAEADPVRAGGLYSAALHLSPDNPAVLLCVSESLRLLGDQESSVRMLQKALTGLLPRSEWRGPLIRAHLRAYSLAAGVLDMPAGGP
ncbi:MAG: hypothetical protein ACOC7S_01855 [Planctomycetota bacterium]